MLVMPALHQALDHKPSVHLPIRKVTLSTFKETGLRDLMGLDFLHNSQPEQESNSNAQGPFSTECGGWQSLGPA